MPAQTPATPNIAGLPWYNTFGNHDIVINGESLFATSCKASTLRMPENPSLGSVAVQAAWRRRLPLPTTCERALLPASLSCCAGRIRGCKLMLHVHK